MRVFIAIEFEEEIKNYFLKVQEELTKFSKRGNFTTENNFHLTVRFIGEVETDDITSLITAIEDVTRRTKSFSLKLSHMGFFPKGNRTIVWAGLEKSDALQRFFLNLEKSLGKQGFPRDRKGLNPHITLGREIDLTEKFDKIKECMPLEKREIKVTKISLMESKRMGMDLVYKPIFLSNLK